MTWIEVARWRQIAFLQAVSHPEFDGINPELPSDDVNLRLTRKSGLGTTGRPHVSAGNIVGVRIKGLDGCVGNQIRTQRALSARNS